MGGLKMKFLKIAAAFAMTTGVASMAPASTCAYSGACNQCYSGCTDAYASDNAPGAEARFSHCVNSCVDENNIPCQIGTG